MNQTLILIFQLVVLIFSVIIHEVSHGLTAYKLGDPTAKEAGRLTLNPLKHLDFFGSFLLPLVLYLIGSPILFGWAKPVPFNPYYLKNPKRDSGLIGLAGPLSNLTVAVAFSLILNALAFFGAVNAPLALFFDIIILINVVLGVFNIIPIPPLDGSKILFSLLPKNLEYIQAVLERYGIVILLFFIFFAFQFITPIIFWLYNLLGSGILA